MWFIREFEFLRSTKEFGVPFSSLGDVGHLLQMTLKLFYLKT
jgi:hypothetical protein